MTTTERTPCDAVIDCLRQTRLLAIVRTAATSLIPGIVETLAQSGVRAVEIALARPDTITAIRSVARRRIPGLLLGAGTVLDASAAAAVLDAGATYFVSPAVVPEVIRFAAERDLAVFPGAYTATEILTATGLGAPAVKLFPASACGSRLPQGTARTAAIRPARAYRRSYAGVHPGLPERWRAGCRDRLTANRRRRRRW